MTHELGPLPVPYMRLDDGSSVYLADNMRRYALAEVERAVDGERERCAKVCEVITLGCPRVMHTERILELVAEAIRKGDEQ